jgi:ADP-ribose pyrophosphatase
VADERVPWSVACSDYAAVPHTDASVLTAPWADPDDLPGRSRSEVQSRLSSEGPLRLEEDTGYPINPIGRTGMRCRGLLGKWGPNHAADPIVTRIDPETGRLQVVVIARSDTGQWALPGGMVDPGESVSATVRREFSEEAGNFADDPEKQRVFNELCEQLFSSGQVVYRGYVDDPRNTDNAWMETTAFHFHCSDELGKLLPLNAGDDASKVKWLSVDGEDAQDLTLYANHGVFIRHTVQEFHRTRAQT